MRTYGSLELSGTFCTVDLHIDSSVTRDATLSVFIPESSNMGVIGSEEGEKRALGGEQEERVEVDRKGCREGRGEETDLIFDNWHLLFLVRFECSFESTLLLAPSSLVK
jgi:hypothetical protein